MGVRLFAALDRGEAGFELLRELPRHHLPSIALPLEGEDWVGVFGAGWITPIASSPLPNPSPTGRGYGGVQDFAAVRGWA